MKTTKKAGIMSGLMLTAALIGTIQAREPEPRYTERPARRETEEPLYKRELNPTPDEIQRICRRILYEGIRACKREFPLPEHQAEYAACAGAEQAAFAVCMGPTYPRPSVSLTAPDILRLAVNLDGSGEIDENDLVLAVSYFDTEKWDVDTLLDYVSDWTDLF